jgi:hypothetical protein
MACTYVYTFVPDYCSYVPLVLFLSKDMFIWSVGNPVASRWAERKHFALSINRKVELFMISER